MTPHMIRTEEEKVALAKEVIIYLNEVLALDPEALHQLCEHRVRVNDKLAGHDTTQTGVLVDGGYSAVDPTQDVLGVGMLGILNGLVGVRSDCWGYITAVYGNDGKLQRFE